MAQQVIPDSSVASEEILASDAPLCNPHSWEKRLHEHRVSDKPTRLVVLGSTGSIGVSALEIARKFPDRFEVVALSSAGSRPDLLAAQVAEFKPKFVGVTDRKGAEALRGAFPTVEICDGENGSQEAAVRGDVVVAGISGVAGLSATEAALRAGLIVALANKESIVCGADILARALRDNPRAMIIPVDSEHSSLAQLLLGVPDVSFVSSLTLTASGGPFLNRPLETFAAITPEEAVRHPRWSMGAKISIDSSTLVNKALEWFEAVYLFRVPRVEIVIHPQSIVHACVSLRDGAMLANLSHPDMQLPIGFAIGIGERMRGLVKPLDLATLGSLTFAPVDELRFPSIALAREAMSAGTFGTCVYSLANEVAVDRFCRYQIRYDQIVPFIREALQRCPSRALDERTAIEELFTQIRAL
jgi:1-deoxy-D-xylulose-5-phosphate reductoisomerase